MSGKQPRKIGKAEKTEQVPVIIFMSPGYQQPHA